jgi:hypothetical protein
VILTPNEVSHARAYPFPLAAVMCTCYDPWTLDDGELRPLGYKYLLPGKVRSEPALGLEPQTA